MKKSPFWMNIFCLFFFLQVIFFVSCSNSRQKDEMIIITDMVGDIVEVPKNPKKIAVLARSAVDMLVAFGLGDNITGVFETVFDNEWAEILYPAISSFHKYNYSTTIEIYLEHGVDLVICPEQYLAENLREYGIPAITVSQYGNPNYDNYVFYFADMIKEIWDDTQVAMKVNLWKSEFSQVHDQIIMALSDVSTTKSLFYVRGDRNRGIAYTEANDKSIQNIIINEANANEVWQSLSAFQNDSVFNIGVGFVMFEHNGNIFLSGNSREILRAVNLKNIYVENVCDSIDSQYNFITIDW